MLRGTYSGALCCLGRCVSVELADGLDEARKDPLELELLLMAQR